MGNWGLWLLATGTVALFLDDKALYVMLYALAGLVFLSASAYRAVAARVSVVYGVDAPRLQHGGETVLCVRISNPTRLPIPSLTVSCLLPSAMVRVPGTLIGTLPPRGTMDVEYPLIGFRRGVYSAGDLRIALGDGVTDTVWRAAMPPNGVVITVYPRIWPVSAMRLPSRNPYGQTRSPIRFFEDASRVIGVRDYEPGDSPRRINWRATARVGELQVKDYQPTISLDTVILLDLDPRGYPMSSPEDFAEMAIEAAASFAHHLLTLGQAVGLITNVGRSADGAPAEISIRQGKGDAQLTRIMDLLAKVSIREGTDFAKAVHAGRMGAQPGSTMIVVMPGGRDDAFDSCLILQRAGYKVVLVVIGGTDSPGRLSAMAAAGVRVWRVHSVNDLQRLAV